MSLLLRIMDPFVKLGSVLKDAFNLSFRCAAKSGTHILGSLHKLSIIVGRVLAYLVVILILLPFVLPPFLLAGVLLAIPLTLLIIKEVLSMALP